jgi:hypothetical protein
MRRRTVLSLAAAAAGAGASALSGGAANAQLLMPQNLPSDLIARPSPPTTPFIAPLQIMRQAQPIDPARLDPPPDPSKHQRYDEFPPVKFYEQALHVKQATQLLPAVQVRG